MPGSASLGILDTIQKRVDRSRRGFFALATLRSSCVPASLVRKSTSMLHDYTNTELPQGQKRYVETSEAVVTLTVSPSHFTFFSVFHSFKPQRSRTRQSTKRKRQRDTSFTKALRAPSRLHKIPLSGMGVGTAHTGVSGGKKGQDSTTKAQFLERYVVYCTASSCVYASSYLSSVF